MKKRKEKKYILGIININSHMRDDTHPLKCMKIKRNEMMLKLMRKDIKRTQNSNHRHTSCHGSY